MRDAVPQVIDQLNFRPMVKIALFLERICCGNQCTGKPRLTNLRGDERVRAPSLR